jgi:hypothetical protein
MVHFPGLARTRLCIQRAVYWFYQYGFPHSDTPGSKPACGSPRLIAACHVLHRLLAPRHPPYALSSLTIKLTQHAPSGALRNSDERSCSPSSHSPEFHECAFRPVKTGLKRTRFACGKVRLSTLRYSRAKICGLLRHATLKSHNAMPTSFSCQRSCVPLNSFRSERLRSRRSASSVWSRGRGK